MTQSLSRIILHIVFSTKNRYKSIPLDITSNLHAYLAATCRKQGGEDLLKKHNINYDEQYLWQ